MQSKPWENESNREVFHHKGFPCIINRAPVGAWCGYVGVPPGHPYYEKDYDKIEVSVHGGLTYSEKCHGVICHKVEHGEEDAMWWLGFDCAHSGDLVPHLPFDTHFDTYRHIDYVRLETKYLADQLGDAWKVQVKNESIP